MAVLWHHGVDTGRLTPNEFVRVTSTNAAQIFNLYPRKGAIAVGADADLVVWDPSATKTISREDASSEGRLQHLRRHDGDRPGARYTLSQGKLVWADGELRTERGAGRYVKRPAFAPVFER